MTQSVVTDRVRHRDCRVIDAATRATSPSLVTFGSEGEQAEPVQGIAVTGIQGRSSLLPIFSRCYRILVLSLWSDGHGDLGGLRAVIIRAREASH